MIPKSDINQLWELLRGRDAELAFRLARVGLRSIFDVYSAEYKRLSMPERLDILDGYASLGVGIDDLQHPFITLMAKFSYVESYSLSVFCHGVGEITDYLLKLRNLSPLERLAMEGTTP